MKIFISWSGNTSKEVAEYLKNWIEQIIQAAEPWISIDIEKGKRWNHEISQKLTESKVGIFCITKENVNSPWILFEAGAIGKATDSYVCTFLINLVPTDLTGPLSLFQATKNTKEDVFKLLSTINQNIVREGSRGLSPDNLKSMFEIFYPKLEENIQRIIKDNTSPGVDDADIRSDRELLEESIQLLRDIKQTKTAQQVIDGEARELLDFYANKYAKTLSNVPVSSVGNPVYIDEFLRYIHDNPLLLKAFRSKENLRAFISNEYDDLPF